MARNFGPADNAQFFTNWLKTDPMFDTLFVSGVNIPPLSGDYSSADVPTMAFLCWYGRHLILHPNKPLNRTSVMVGSWADLLGPMINEGRIAQGEQARLIFKACVSRIIQEDVRGRITNSGAAEYVAINGNTQAEWDQAIANNAAFTANTAMKILIFIVANTNPGMKFGGASIIVHVMLSILKRGTLSSGFVDKIVQGISNDINLPGLRIDIEACQIFYQNFGGMVSDTNIEAITTRWSGNVPQAVTRLRLTILQAAGSGLTALTVTGRAIATFSSFNWTRVRQLYQAEWANLVNAVNAVGDNKWYGFRHDLGPVTSTKYKNISYIAKELLVKINGETSLNAYAGWTRRAKYQNIVDLMIAEYENAYTEFIVNNTPIPAAEIHADVTDMMQAIRAAPTVYV